MRTRTRLVRVAIAAVLAGGALFSSTAVIGHTQPVAELCPRRPTCPAEAR